MIRSKYRFIQAYVLRQASLTSSRSSSELGDLHDERKAKPPVGFRHTDPGQGARRRSWKLFSPWTTSREAKICHLLGILLTVAYILT